MSNRPELKVVEGGSDGQEEGAGGGARPDREDATARARSCASAPTTASMDVEAISTGSLGLDIALGIGGLPRGRVVEIYGPEVLRQDHARPAGRRRGPEEGRHLRLRRRRARARSGLRQEARRQGRGPADLAARHRRAGAGDRRHAGALRRRRRAGRRLGRRAHAQGRARRRDGRHAARHAGAPDEQGAAQAHRLDLQVASPW